MKTKSTGTVTLISQHTSPGKKRPARLKKTPEWIRMIATYLKSYHSYHIYIGGLYKETGQAYNTIFLADIEAAHPNRVTAGASIINTSPADKWKVNNWKTIKDTPLLCIHIKDGSKITAQLVYLLLAIVAVLQRTDNIPVPINKIVTDALGYCHIENRIWSYPQLTKPPSWDHRNTT